MGSHPSRETAGEPWRPPLFLGRGGPRKVEGDVSTPAAPRPPRPPAAPVSAGIPGSHRGPRDVGLRAQRGSVPGTAPGGTSGHPRTDLPAGPPRMLRRGNPSCGRGRRAGQPRAPRLYSPPPLNPPLRAPIPFLGGGPGSRGGRGAGPVGRGSSPRRQVQAARLGLGPSAGSGCAQLCKGLPLRGHRPPVPPPTPPREPARAGVQHLCRGPGERGGTGRGRSAGPRARRANP